MTESALTEFTPRPDSKAISIFPEGETVVSMVDFLDRVIVATTHNVYVYRDGVLTKCYFQEGWEKIPVPKKLEGSNE
jgi:hypothetical protein